MKNKFLKYAPVCAVAAMLGTNVAFAQAAPDPATIVTSATSAANAVMALVLTVAGFFSIVKIVKWIRK